MNKETVRRSIAEIGIIPAIRLSSFDDAVFAAGAVVDGGIPIVSGLLWVNQSSGICHRNGHPAFPDRGRREPSLPSLHPSRRGWDIRE